MPIFYLAGTGLSPVPWSRPERSQLPCIDDRLRRQRLSQDQDPAKMHTSAIQLRIEPVSCPREPNHFISHLKQPTPSARKRPEAKMAAGTKQPKSDSEVYSQVRALRQSVAEVNAFVQTKRLVGCCSCLRLLSGVVGFRCGGGGAVGVPAQSCPSVWQMRSRFEDRPAPSKASPPWSPASKTKFRDLLIRFDARAHHRGGINTPS
jgi:hypothetical protein